MTSFLDTGKAAEVLNLSPRTLEKWRITGEGPFYRKFGGRVLYTPEDLERFADDRRRISTSQKA